MATIQTLYRLDRGYVATDYTPEGRKAFDQIHAEVRKRLINRTYSETLLSRVVALAEAPKK